MATVITFVNSLFLGLLASFSPCLFPVLPTFLAYLSKNEDNNGRSGLIASFLVTLGIMTVFVISGIIYQSIIGFFAPNYLKFRTIQGIILIFLGILLLLQFSTDLSFTNRLNNLASQAIDRIENQWVLAYLIGLVFTLLAAPCALIVFFTVFVLITGETLLTSALVMVVFSIGAGIPFFLVGGLIPQINEVLIEKKQQFQLYLSILAGLLIVGVGTFLTLDGLRLL